MMDACGELLMAEFRAGLSMVPPPRVVCSMGDCVDAWDCETVVLGVSTGAGSGRVLETPPREDWGVGL